MIEETHFTYEYLPWRGISRDTMAFYDVKTKVDPSGAPLEIGFRYPNGAYKVRRLDIKDFRSTHNNNGAAPQGCFGLDRFDRGGHRYVTITEGELDALSLYQALSSPVVSVRSSSSADTDAGLVRSWLQSFERVYLAFDNDRAGRDAAARVARLFDYNKVFDVRFDRRKDANEYLVAGEVDDLRNIWWNAKRYQPDNIKSSLQDFKEILEESPQQGIPYPFRTLTDMTYGIRTGETVLFTAQEGVGKTELMHDLLYSILKGTDYNVGAIFLEEPKARLLQAIAGRELKRPVHLPDSGCSIPEVTAALEKVVGVDDRLFVYSHFGSTDPDILVETIRFLVTVCSCRIVILDHITMGVSGLGEQDERRALDQLSTKLEMMVKELDYGLIIVSHVNDDGQTRGSRYISKVSDIRIDLRRDLLADDPLERNRTYLTISKNRYCGCTGSAGILLFDLVGNSYREEVSHEDERQTSRTRPEVSNLSRESSGACPDPFFGREKSGSKATNQVQDSVAYANDNHAGKGIDHAA